MSDLTKLTLAAAKEKIAKKEVSSVELTKAYLEAIDARNPELNAYIVTTHHVAMEQARHSDERIAKGEARALEGLPIAVKDLFCTKDIQTTAASNMLRGFVPAYESTVTQNLLDAGTVTLGKTNLDEFAMGSANITSAFGNVKNPWKGKDGKELVPGGSSGGSAAAVSADLCLAALGTDTGGSIRQPAAFTGIVGFKPTYGRCSRWGIIAFASSLDQAGPMTKTVEDAGLMFGVMAGHDAKDSTSSRKAVPDVLPLIKAGVKGKRIGIPKEYRPDGLDAEIVAMWEKGAQLLREAGAEIVEISLPHTEYALATYYVLAPAECSSNLARYDGVRYGNRVYDKGDSIERMYEKTRAAGFGAEVKRRIMIGTYVLSAGYYDAYYKKAQRVRSLIIDDFRKAFEKVDVILTPTAPTPAFGFGENMDDPVTMYLNDVFTIPASLAGLPGLALPAGLNSNGLPLGLQLLANNFDESGLFAVAGTLEQALGFSAKAV
jgi:aspartyl-tRNA(Asn)/glutamyl-tRNA(Gln) amidotransferase subunit A